VLHYSDFAGNFKSFLVSSKGNIGLFSSIGSVKSVHFLHFDLVEFLASFPDLSFVCLLVDDEHECVVVFNSFNGAFSGKGVLDDGVFVPGALRNDGLSGELRFPCKFEGRRSSEGGGLVDSVLLLLMGSLLQCFGG
jgi:hypothetical protein